MNKTESAIAPGTDVHDDAARVSSRQANRRRRTRRDLLQAAARLMREGRTPTFEEIAEAAMVSRATAYRYFSGLEPLLLEASVEVATPDPAEVLRGVAGDDPVARVERVDEALHDMILANEAAVRRVVAHSLTRVLEGEGRQHMPARQNRRMSFIEEALAPARERFTPASLKLLSRALALLIGPETVMVSRDVLMLDDAEARRVKRWMIQVLVEAAERPVGAAGRRWVRGRRPPA